MLLSVAACNNKRPIQAAVLHGISVIAAVVQPHMLTSDTSLTELLAQGAEWAANLGRFNILGDPKMVNAKYT